MGYRPRKIKFKKTDLLLGALAFSAGVLAALGGIQAYERMQAVKEVVPLRPGDGDAGSSLSITWLPETVSRWKPQIEKYGNQYEVDPNLIAIMMTVESGGDPNADSGFAQGLMQVTESTAKDINTRYVHVKRDSYELKDPETSIEFGTAYIRHMTNTYGGAEHGPTWDKTVGLVAAGYNGGFAAANAYYTKGLAGLEISETYNYVRYVTTMWRERHDDRSFAYRFWRDEANGQALIRAAERYSPPQQ